jgi:hypothetical protein
MLSRKKMIVFFVFLVILQIAVFAIVNPWMPIFGWRHAITDSLGRTVEDLTVTFFELSSDSTYSGLYVLACELYYVFQILLFAFSLFAFLRLLIKKGPFPRWLPPVLIAFSALFLAFGLGAFVRSGFFLPITLVVVCGLLCAGANILAVIFEKKKEKNEN